MNANQAMLEPPGDKRTQQMPPFSLYFRPEMLSAGGALMGSSQDVFKLPGDFTAQSEGDGEKALASEQTFSQNRPRAKIHFDNFALIEDAFNRRNLSSFLAAAEAVDWDCRSADDFVQTVERALSLGAFDLARRLALKGHQLHAQSNQSPRLAQLARTLAPARVLRADLPADPAIELNRNWLRAHANEYRNRWVAIKKGKLLADGATIQELVSKIPDRIGALLMRVP